MDFIIPAAIIIIVLIVFFTMVPVGLWITARFSGVNISMASLVAMRFRRLNPNLIVNALIKSHQAGIPIRTEDLESHYLAGGNINQVVDALIAAERANIDLTFEQAAAIDLAGRNVFEAVQVSVTPKVINTPVIAAVAKNGIEVKVIAKVTVRANIDRLVGGAGEETIIARVGEGIVTTVGSADSHAQVLENPDNISQTVLLKGLDSGTAYEILSIDIADVDVGRNVGAELQRDQAEADKNIAQAKAEERRAQAIALEQENKAKVVEAEARIPEAIAKAFEEGNLGIMDYYNMRNVNADTRMRESLSDVDSGDFDV
ncbi:flotillin-like protein FloA [Anaerococcus urinomassiliensis]|uniref:flotillin-like protein FloA n=1 Tax=Anaerococcus urinomassiliensis TaxID=1745712 RepID=UPI00093F6E02|nr:flotillin-like protein FloA [Anaerococcus urinomassiliensis]